MNTKGQIEKGEHLSRNTEFKPGHKPWSAGKNIGSMSGKKHSEATKKKMSAARMGIKFSFETIMRLSKSHLGINTGKDHPNWKGGISTQYKNERGIAMEKGEYRSWRKTVFHRDDHTCQICGERGGSLRANHIKRYVDYPELRTEVKNGITICKKCDLSKVMGREKTWEQYFYSNLEGRGLL